MTAELIVILIADAFSFYTTPEWQIEIIRG